MILAALSALIIIGIGTLLRTLGVLKREHGPILVQVTLYVLLPAAFAHLYTHMLRARGKRLGGSGGGSGGGGERKRE